MAESKGDEDVTLDFGKITGIFRKKDHPKGHASRMHERSDDDSDREDRRKAENTPSALPQVVLIILLLLLPLGINVYLRTMPNRLEITDDFARSTIYNNVKANVKAEIQKQYPYLPDTEINNRVNTQFNSIIKSQKTQVEDAIRQNSDYIKSQFKDDQGYTYLGDIDSYFWLRYAQNVVKNGYIGDELRNGVQYDNHMMAPIGLPADVNIYPYVEAYLYKVLSFFSPKMTLMQAAFYTPLFLSIIAIIAAFFIGRKIAGNMGGFFAAMMTAVHPSIVTRSLGSDNDIINMVFPFLILLLFLYAFDSKSLKNRLIFTSLTGIMVGIYSFSWAGYWYLFYFLLGTILCFIAYKVIYSLYSRNGFSFDDKEIHGMIMMLALFLVFSAASIALFSGYAELSDVPFKPIKILSLKAASKSESLWPNVYTTVAELNEASLSEVITSVGSDVLFLLSLLGIVLTLVDFSKNKILSGAYLLVSLIAFVALIGLKSQIRLLIFLICMWIPILAGLAISVIKRYKIDIKYALILALWFTATLYASTKGVRFVLLILPAFIVGLALFIGKIHKLLADFISDQLQLSRAVSQVIIIFVLILLLIEPVRSGYTSARSYIPNVNDGWVASLEKIRQDSKPDAIVNSWWDFGHWFKYFTDRAVTFDGASQNKPQAHWIGKVLLTSDEQQAVSILRMLDCGANNAFNALDKDNKDTLETVGLLYKVLPENRADARNVLLNHVSPAVADEVLNLTHCSPPQDYFITSEDMVGKSGVWAHFGSWDFLKARIYYYFTTKTHDDFSASLQRDMNLSKDAAEKYYYELQALRTDRDVNNWIAPWPSYGGSSGCAQQGDYLQCVLTLSQNQQVPFTINMTTYDAFIRGQDKPIYPKSFGYVRNGSFEVKQYSANTMDYSVVLVNESNSYYVVFMSPELVGSMFTRLFFLNGAGLANFEKFSDVTDITGSRIIVWKVKWPN